MNVCGRRADLISSLNNYLEFFLNYYYYRGKKLHTMSIKQFDIVTIHIILLRIIYSIWHLSTHLFKKKHWEKLHAALSRVFIRQCCYHCFFSSYIWVFRWDYLFLFVVHMYSLLIIFNILLLLFFVQIKNYFIYTF